MGRVRLTARAVSYLLIAVGGGLFCGGVVVLAGLGWALITAGVAAVGAGLLLVDIPTPAERQARR